MPDYLYYLAMVQAPEIELYNALRSQRKSGIFHIGCNRSHGVETVLLDVPLAANWIEDGVHIALQHPEHFLAALLWRSYDGELLHHFVSYQAACGKDTFCAPDFAQLAHSWSIAGRFHHRKEM